MKILIACDSFKDALDAPSVCRAIAQGLNVADTSFETRIFPLADGGEGLADVLHFHLGLKKHCITVSNPLFQKVTAVYHITKDNNVAFIEMAQAAGLQLLPMEVRNPLKTTTYGVGEMIQDALQKGAKKIILGIGGSATNDLGIGMAVALGFQFLDKNGQQLVPIGGNLIHIAQVIPPQGIYSIEFEVMCDVKNPLLGENGAAHIYAKQKGADDTAIDLLENGAKNLVAVLKIKKEMLDKQGAGAAGGLGFGASYFLKANLKSGINAVMDLTQFEAQVAWADLIITGEGKLDRQTAQGKLIAGILSIARAKPVVAVCGSLDCTPQYIKELGLKAAFSISQKPSTLSEALHLTAENLTKTAFSIGSLLKL